MTYYELLEQQREYARRLKTGEEKFDKSKQASYIWGDGVFKKSVFGKNPGEIITTEIPACRKCLEMDGELDECPNCAHEPALTKGKRYYCPRCVKKHKNPRDCSDCTV